MERSINRLNAAARLVVAEGEWFDMLSDDMKKQYIEEHPDSKYAKGYKLQSPSKPMQPGPNPKAPQQPQQPKKLNQRTEESLKKLPKSAQQFVKKGGTKPNSPARKQSAAQVRAAAPKLARGILKDSVGVATGIVAMRNLLEFKPKDGDFKKAASLVGTVLGTSAMMAVLGASGPVGFLAFMAVKHVAAPKLYDVVKNALAPDVKQKRDDYDPQFGYWKDKDTWVPISEEEYDSLTDDEVNEYQRTGRDPHGKFNQFENRKLHKPDADNNEVEDVDFKEIPHSAAVLRLANLATATDDEKQMIALIQGLSDFAASGEIPEKAWATAIEEMAQVMSADDQQDE